jgi:hypothetical protein
MGLLIACASHAADTPGGPVALGVIGQPILGETGCPKAASAETGIPLYAEVGGTVAARLQWTQPPAQGCAVYLVRDGQPQRLYRPDDMPEIDYESAALAFFDVRGEFALVFAQAFPPGYWIRFRDVPDGRLHRWPELVMASDHFGYRDFNGLALHQAPSADSPVLVTLRERRVAANPVHQLLPIGELAGDWGRFDVIEFNGDFDPMAQDPDAKPTGRRWTGWLRLVDERGARRLWFYTRD